MPKYNTGEEVYLNNSLVAFKILEKSKILEGDAFYYEYYVEAMSSNILKRQAVKEQDIAFSLKDKYKQFKSKRHYSHT